MAINKYGLFSKYGDLIKKPPGRPTGITKPLTNFKAGSKTATTQPIGMKPLNPAMEGMKFTNTPIYGEGKIFRRQGDTVDPYQHYRRPLNIPGQANINEGTIPAGVPSHEFTPIGGNKYNAPIPIGQPEAPAPIGNKVATQSLQTTLSTINGGGGAGTNIQAGGGTNARIAGIPGTTGWQGVLGEQGSKWLSNLMNNPITADIGLSNRERQGIYNLSREQIQGSTRAAAEGAKEIMGGRGFIPGKSGIADTAIGQILSRGQQQLGGTARDIALQEARNRFNQNMAVQGLNLQRAGVGFGAIGNLSASAAREKAAQLQAEAQRYAVQASQAGSQAQLGWQKEKFGQTFQFQQEQAATNNLFRLLGLENQSQQNRYQPYWQGLVNAYGS